MTTRKVERATPVHRHKVHFLFFIVATAFSYSHATVRFGSYDSAITLNNNVTFDITKSFTNKEGEIRQRNNAALTGNTIYFNEGLLEQSLAPVVITGHYHPDISGTGTIELHGTQAHPQIFRADSGTLITLLQVQGDGNRIEGFPLFENPIQLLDKNTTVTIAIGSVLNQNINLNGGIIILEENLDLADDVSLTGPGTIKLNDRRLSFGSKDLVLTSSLYWIGAADVYLNGRVDLSGSWTFEGECYFNGDSTILNLLPGGDLTIRENSSLNLRETKIKGLGFEPGEGRIWFADPGIEGPPDVLSTSKLRLRRAALELTTTYTFDRGHVIAEIGSNQVITRENTLFFEKPGHLTVDGINLFYKTRTFTDNNNIKPLEFNTSDSPIEIIREGDILHYRTFNTIRARFSDFNEGEDNDNTYIGVGHEKIIGAGNVTIDGHGWYWHFARFNNYLLSFQNTSAVNFTNIRLKDFRLRQTIDVDPSTLSDIVLGPNTVVELGRNTILNYGSGITSNHIRKKLFISGTDVVINGNGHSMLFESDSKILLQESSELKLENLTLFNIKSNSFVFEDNTELTLSNIKINLDESIEIAGDLAINGDVEIYSSDGSEVTITLDPPHFVTIKEGTILHIGPNVTLKIKSDDFSIFEGGVLSLDQATLAATTAGLSFRAGTVRIHNKSFFTSEATNLSEAILLGIGEGTASRIKLMPGASLEIVNGIVDYDSNPETL